MYLTDDHHTKSSAHLSPYKLNPILLNIFPFSFFTHPSHYHPTKQNRNRVIETEIKVMLMIQHFVINHLGKIFLGSENCQKHI